MQIESQLNSEQFHRDPKPLLSSGLVTQSHHCSADVSVIKARLQIPLNRKKVSHKTAQFLVLSYKNYMGQNKDRVQTEDHNEYYNYNFRLCQNCTKISCPAVNQCYYTLIHGRAPEKVCVAPIVFFNLHNLNCFLTENTHQITTSHKTSRWFLDLQFWE